MEISEDQLGHFKVFGLQGGGHYSTCCIAGEELVWKAWKSLYLKCSLLQNTDILKIANPQILKGHAVFYLFLDDYGVNCVTVIWML